MFDTKFTRESLHFQDELPRDLRPLGNIIYRENFKKIIEDTELFWVNFCKIFAEKNEKSNLYEITIKTHKNCLYIKGENSTISEIKKFVTKLGKFASETSNLDEASRVMLCVDNRIFLKKPSQNYIDLSQEFLKPKKGIDEDLFKNCVKHHLSPLLSSLGIKYSTTPTTHLVDNGFHPASQKSTTTIALSQTKNLRFFYPIDPAKIPHSSHPEMTFYQNYQSESLCDFSIKSSEGKSLKLHRIVLDQYGGPYFQALLSNGMKETAQAEVEINAPYDLIKNVIDSLYLGPEHFKKKLLNGEEIDVYAILEFAHAHELQPLFKQMINLLILIAPQSDAENIRILADRYEDSDLNRLANHLTENMPHENSN